MDFSAFRAIINVDNQRRELSKLTNHTFLGGMGLGILAGAAMGMAVAAKGMQNPKMRRMAKKATRKMNQMKDDFVDTMGF